MPKVSLIIAAYNIEKYIEQALSSAMKQTLKDIEIIIVDDGSTDNTVQIIKNLISKDPRIIFIQHEHNKGLMLARKSGYDAAHGDYIMFLDGDDYYEVNASEIAYNAISKAKTDILQFCVNPFYHGDSVAEYQPFMTDIQKLLNRQFDTITTTEKGGLHTASDSFHIHHSILNKIYSKNVIQRISKDLPDEHIYMAEDMFFSFFAFFYAASISCINNVLYNYRVGTGISTTSSITDVKMMSVAKGIYMYSFLNNWTLTQNARNICQKHLNKFYDEVARNISRMLLLQLHTAEQREIFITHVLKFCSVSELTTLLVYATYALLLTEKEELAEICSTLSVFQAKGNIVNKIAYLTNTEIFSSENSDNSFVYLTDDMNFQSTNCPVLQLPQIQDNTANAYRKRIDCICNIIHEHEIDLVVDCRSTATELTADALAVKCAQTIFAFRTDGQFLSGFNTSDIYALRTQLSLYKTCSLADCILPGSDSDLLYFTQMGLHCITEKDFRINYVQKNSTPKNNTLHDAIENILHGLTAYVQENRLGKELQNSIKYASELETRLKEAVTFGNDMEQGFIRSVDYAHELEAQIAHLQSQLSSEINEKKSVGITKLLTKFKSLHKK